MTSVNTLPELRIVEGPGKSDLMFSTFDGKIVTFTVTYYSNDPKMKTAKSKIQARVFQIGLESGCYKSWIIKLSTDEGTYLGWYHSGRREGHLSEER